MQKTYTSAKGQVLSDTEKGGCSIASYTKCPKVDLSDQYLQGAFLSYADMRGANLSGVNLKAGSISFGDFADVNFTGAVERSHAGVPNRPAWGQRNPCV